MGLPGQFSVTINSGRLDGMKDLVCRRRISDHMTGVWYSCCTYNKTEKILILVLAFEKK